MKKTQSTQPQQLPSAEGGTPSSINTQGCVRIPDSLIAHPSSASPLEGSPSRFDPTYASEGAKVKIHHKPPLNSAHHANVGPALQAEENSRAAFYNNMGAFSSPSVSKRQSLGGRGHSSRAFLNNPKSAGYHPPASHLARLSQKSHFQTQHASQAQMSAQLNNTVGEATSDSPNARLRHTHCSSGNLMNLCGEARRSESSSSMQCAICFERYSEREHRPRILPLCGHSLCQVCLQRAVALSLKESSGLFCHICKKEIPADILRQSTLRKNQDQISLHGFPINWSLAELSDQHLKLKNQLNFTSNLTLNQCELAALNTSLERGGTDEVAMRNTADSYRRSENIKSLCFQCKGQSQDTHFCRAHLLKFCGGCALRHLKNNPMCVSQNILEISSFDDYAQQVKERGHQFQLKLVNLESDLHKERAELAHQVYDKLDSLIEVLAQTKRDVKQHYDLRQYILIQYRERVEKAISALADVDTASTMTLQKLRDSALRMNKLGELMSEGERMLNCEVKITDALKFSPKNYQKLQLAVVELIEKEDLEAYVGIGEESPRRGGLRRDSSIGRRQRSCSLRTRSVDNEDQRLSGGPVHATVYLEERAGSARVRFGSNVGLERRQSNPFVLQGEGLGSKNGPGKSSKQALPRVMEKQSINLTELSQRSDSMKTEADAPEIPEIKAFHTGDPMVPRKELFGACAQGYARSVEFLLDNFDFPGGINVKDSTGCTPFLKAAQAGQPQVYKMLVRKYYSNTNVQDNNGRTALIHAALTNDTELASFLVKECKADVNLQTKWKDTALHFAVSHDNHEMVKLLVQDGGANMKVVNSDLKRPKALAKSREVRSILARLAEG